MLKPEHVLIIGGGLAGPCLALSLARHAIRSTVFEIRPSRGDGGGSLTLTPSAVAVLDRYAGVADRVRAEGYQYFRMGAYFNDGKRFGEVVVGDESEHGYPAVRIMRSRLHEIMLEECGRRGIRTHYGAKLAEIVEGDEGVTATFEDGSTASGDILVGADGIHSTVRKHVLGAASPLPEFFDQVVVYGFVPSASVVNSTPDLTFPAFIFTRYGVLMTIPIDSKSDRLAWSITKPVFGDRSREEWREMERSGSAARTAKADYDGVTAKPIRSLLDRAQDDETRLWPVHVIPDLPSWHLGRVCLIGDAAHGLPPNGQGSAYAFEDAAILTRLLTADLGLASYDEIFGRYERIRQPRLAKQRDGSKKGGAVKSETNVVVWILKRLVIRLYFWFNGGELLHIKETAYDVDAVDITK